MGPIYTRSPEAGRDLDEIFEWIAREASEARAIKVIQRLEAKFQMIAEFPGIGRHRELAGGLLGASEPPWLVLYEHLVGKSGVRILRVVDGRRDLPTVLGMANQ